MKTKSTFLFSLFLHASFCTGQNLVPNPSFEEYADCPFSGGLLEYATGWINPTGYSPDYLNACVTTTEDMGIPNNTYGEQSARTGNSYAGIITMIETDAREYIQVRLINDLIATHIYRITFYVAIADISTYASNDIGAYISYTPIYSIPSNSVLNLSYFPQITNNPVVNPLDMKDTWIKIEGTYIANGGERYLTIGNFKDDASTDTTNYSVLPSPWWTASYHYIDDVSVICLDCPVGISEVFEGRINIFPNPVSDYLNVYLDKSFFAKITVLNNVSKPVFISEKIKNKTFQLDVSQYSSGVYFIKVETNDFSTTKKFFINH